jgi:hypothetical protein
MATNNSSDYSPTQYNVQSGGANGTLNNIAPSTSGYVLTSNGGSAQPTFQANSGAIAIQTIDGNTGSVTGSTVTIETPASSGTLNFRGTSTTMTLNLVDANNNLAIGSASSISGGSNAIAIGNSATATTSGGVAIGANSSITFPGTASVAIGSGATSSGGESVVVGNSAVDNGGENNVSIGNSASTSSNGLSVAVGADSIAGEFGISLGYNAGNSFSGPGEGNIYIGNIGANEGNTIRIGTQGSTGGEQNLCYIAGIHGATPVTGNTPQVVLCDNAGNLAPISSSTSGFVLTSNGTATPSFQAIPAAGVTSIAGTTNQIAASASTGAVTLSLVGPYTPATYTAHGVLIGEGTGSIVALAAGSSGQVLQSGGASANPAYSTATYPATATGTGTILRADGTNWSATTATYPNTTTSQQILYSSSSNVVGQLTTANSSLAATNASGTLAMRALSVNVQVITGTGTYTASTGMLYAKVEVLGGGGGGGGAGTTTTGYSGGGSGSAGEYASGVFSAATIGATQTVTIGAAGAANSGASGGNGGNTSFGAIITANGGVGGVTTATGAVANGAGVLGGTGGTGGTVRTPGSPGGSVNWAVGASLIFASNGASSQYGAGGLAGIIAAGSAALGYGAGGGAATNATSGAAKSGGAGTAGIVIVTEYIIN